LTDKNGRQQAPTLRTQINFTCRYHCRTVALFRFIKHPEHRTKRVLYWLPTRAKDRMSDATTGTTQHKQY